MKGVRHDMDPSFPTVVCFAGDDYWHSNPHSRFHIMKALHRRGHRILWINSLGMNLPKVGRKGFVRKVTQRFRSWLRWLRPAHDGFHVLTPIALPLFGHRLIEVVNDRWITAQIRLAYWLLAIRKPLVFASTPSYGGVIRKLPRDGMIYYYSDKYDSYHDITALQSIRRLDEQLFTAADAVFCASQEVCDSLVTRRPDVYYLPHAVDFRHFNDVLGEDVPPPADIAMIPRPRIGYFGSLNENNNQDLVAYAAELDPQLQFVLIGRPFGDFSRLRSLTNVHFLGFKPYAELPRYAKNFDVAFMDWKMTDWIRHSNPLKTQEYLSLGLPVVAVPIKELRLRFGDCMTFASDGPEFLAAIKSCLGERDPDLKRIRIDKVRGESWDSRVDEMMKLYGRARSRTGAALGQS